MQPLRVPVLATLVLALLADAGSAQVPLSGNLSDATTGPLQSGVVYHVSGTIGVLAGDTLTAQPGAIVKFPGGSLFEVRGTLDALGTPADPVVFTDLQDDSAGGDTNGNGPSVGTPGSWYGIQFFDTSDASSLAHTHVRYGGLAGAGNVTLFAADITLTDCTLSDGAGPGLDLQKNGSKPTVSGCSFLDNGAQAVRWAHLWAVPGFTSNTASGNAGGDFMLISDLTIPANATITAANVLGGALVLEASGGVQVGATLTVGPGVVFKVSTTHVFEVRGTLLASGTAADPVVWTTIADDDHGGDTNLDGPSSGTPGFWFGVQFFDAADASVLEHCIVRYAGFAGSGNVTLFTADITMTDCTLSDGAGPGLDLQKNGASPTVSGCSLLDNGAHAVRWAHLGAVPGFTNNSAAGNAAGDAILVSNGGVVGDTVIGPASILGGALLFESAVDVDAGAKLTLLPGTVFKMLPGQFMTVDGALEVPASLEDPVVITSFQDDSWGGDTVNNGPTSGAPGDWLGVQVEPGAAPATIEGLLVRYGGGSGWVSLSIQSPSVTMRNVRSDHSGNVGLRATDLAGDVFNWIAWGASTNGLELDLGAFDVRHVTSVGNAGGGIVDLATGWSGTVVDSIAWGNGGANFSGFAPGEVRYSDGDPALVGSDGNINADPLFVDEPGGDLHLSLFSPCIDAGDPLSPPDPDGSITDMGAYAFDHCEPTPYCTGKLNTAGCVPFVSSTGFPSTTSGQPFVISASDVVSKKNGIFFYGKSGAASIPFQGGTLCVAPTVQRTGLLFSGGNAGPDDCSGTFDFDFNAWLQGGSDPLLGLGVTVNGQFWYRDPADPSSSGLSDAIQFLICQ